MILQCNKIPLHTKMFYMTQIGMGKVNVHLHLIKYHISQHEGVWGWRYASMHS